MAVAAELKDVRDAAAAYVEAFDANAQLAEPLNGLFMAVARFVAADVKDEKEDGEGDATG